MDTILDNQTFIEQVTSLSSLDQIIETIIVDTNEGSISVEKIQKNGDSVKIINEKIDYKLHSTKLIIKSNSEFTKNIIISDIDTETIINNKPLCDCVARNTNNIFAKEFSKLKNTLNYSIEFFKQGFFKKLFSKTKPDHVISKIEEIGKGHGWIIIPKKLVQLFQNSPKFENNNIDCGSVIHNFGSLGDINVYLNPNQIDSKIYFGNYDSLTLLVNRNIKIEENKTLSPTYTKAINMEVNYLFIQNRPITILDIQ